VAQFRYRLQTLLEQKMQAKQEAQHNLAAAQRELRKQQDELEACLVEQEAAAERLQEARVEALSPVAGAATGEWMRLKRAHIHRLEEQNERAVSETKAQELSVTEAGERLAAARETLASSSRDVEGLERHRVRLERRFRAETEKKEALDQEEMANVIFLQGRRTR
jgi:ABC-type transporter Mla subunit MlaD